MGRYCFNKLPFGTSSAPEHFQHRMSVLLTGLQGVLCHMDDVLVFSRDDAEHNQQLEAVLRRVEEAGATLNLSKCEFNRNTLTFLGNVIDANGIRADPSKTEAIREMQPQHQSQQSEDSWGWQIKESSPQTWQSSQNR